MFRLPSSQSTNRTKPCPTFILFFSIIRPFHSAVHDYTEKKICHYSRFMVTLSDILFYLAFLKTYPDKIYY